MYKLIFDFLSVDERKLLLGIAQELHYQPGRQETGYQKAFIDKDKRCFAIRERAMLELSSQARGGFHPASFDAYILHYPEGSYIPLHKDDAPFGSQHWRFNALIQDDDASDLVINGRVVDMHEGDAILFRPDIWEHEVSVCSGRTRYVLSIGVLK